MLWETSGIYFVAGGVSMFVSLGAVASIAYFLQKRAAAVDRHEANEEQTALEKVLLRNEKIPISSSPPTKPLIVSPSFSSPNKVPVRHLRSGSYSPAHYLSPYHSRQPRRNSSPTSTNPPNSPYKLQLHHPQLQESNQNGNYFVEEEVTSTITTSPNSRQTLSSAFSVYPEENVLNLNKANINKKCKNKNSNFQLQNKNVLQPQYYGAIPPRKLPLSSSIIGTVNSNTNINLAPAVSRPLFTSKSNKNNNNFMKSDYIQLPGKNGEHLFHDETTEDEVESCAKKDMPKFKETCTKSRSKLASAEESLQKGNNLEENLRRKLLLQKQFEHNRQQAANSRGFLPKSQKHCIQEDIPFYISSQ